MSVFYVPYFYFHIFHLSLFFFCFLKISSILSFNPFVDFLIVSIILIFQGSLLIFFSWKILFQNILLLFYVLDIFWLFSSLCINLSLFHFLHCFCFLQVSFFLVLVSCIHGGDFSQMSSGLSLLLCI